MVRVASSRVTSIQGTRDSLNPVESLSLNINFDNIKFEKSMLKVNFTYTVTYTTDAGKIVVSGELSLEDSNMKKIEDDFKKTKNLSVDVAEEIVNAASFTGSAAGTLVAYGLNLPAPINTSRAKLTPQAQAKGGAS